MQLYTLSLHDALPIWPRMVRVVASITVILSWPLLATNTRSPSGEHTIFQGSAPVVRLVTTVALKVFVANRDRKSTRLNSSHRCISYAVFRLKKKKYRR